MATATMPQITTEFATTSRDFALASIDREKTATKRVIEAIPENKKTWKPDEKAKTAEELAWHIASVEVGFLHGIAKLSFATMADEEEIQKNPPKTIAEIAKWYESNLPAALAAVQKMTPQQLMTPIDFYGAFNFPALYVPGFLQGPLDPPSRMAGQLSAPDGRQVSQHLRWQRRRTLERLVSRFGCPLKGHPLPLLLRVPPHCLSCCVRDTFSPLSK
jgi:hypothetical protein